jgi:hypothetical protein
LVPPVVVAVALDDLLLKIADDDELVGTDIDEVVEHVLKDRVPTGLDECLGLVFGSGLRRVPSPAARTTACIPR